ncbi:MAG: hypothetical protein ABIO44_12980 [Saprospiraceae bacterium]
MKNFLILIFLSSLISCKKEAKLTYSELKGKWNMTEAFRNDKKTQTLSGAYYEFSDTSITTNIFGEIGTTPFTIEKMDIVQRIPTEVRYHVTKNQDQTLSLVTIIDNVSFRFTLKKE